MNDRSKDGPTPKRPGRTAMQDAAHPGIEMKRIPGGCESCDAYQEVPENFAPGTPGVWVVSIFHDDDCPELARHQA